MGFPKPLDNERIDYRNMLQQGILNPAILSLVARIRHTNTLVIADWAFPYWPQLETVDITLTKGIPTVVQVLEFLLPNFKIGELFMAEEFKTSNQSDVKNSFNRVFEGLKVTYEPHIEFKLRVPSAIGLIRTGDPTPYGNIIIESA
ncbi:MAG: transport protein RbsD/FucU [Verrucomicrobia bacterium]|nr:transport protein RbsD/FucU [Verrucomicrobiota bacterium]